MIDFETLRPLLEALPERELTVLRLRFFENMTQSQIAERLGISQMHVSRLLARCLTSCGKQYEGQNGFELAAMTHQIAPLRGSSQERSHQLGI